MKITEETKVQVTYPDGKGNHTTTVKDVESKWRNRGESDEWVNWFMTNLVDNGVALSGFGKYEIIN